MTAFSGLMTPACLIDRPRLIANAGKMAGIANARGVTLRPHVKTLKSLQAAKYYAPPGSPICVSTLAEASYFAGAGYNDILYAVCLTPNKYQQVSALLQQKVKLTVLVDSKSAVEALCHAAFDSGSPLSVALEVDTDGHRAGLCPDSDELTGLAKDITNANHLQFAGVVAHAGASYSCFTTSEHASMAEQETNRVMHAVKRLRDAGITCNMVSVGSTPTALYAPHQSGITELRAGVYITYDCVMAGLGICQTDDIAMSVLTTVMGVQQDKNQILIDAGWMALSRDKGTTGHKQDCGYGLVCSEQGALLEGWYVVATNQEHGIVRHIDGLNVDAAGFHFGQRLRILPIHACATAAQFSQYAVTDDNSEITEYWARINGW